MKFKVYDERIMGIYCEDSEKEPCPFKYIDIKYNEDKKVVYKIRLSRPRYGGEDVVELTYDEIKFIMELVKFLEEMGMRLA